MSEQVTAAIKTPRPKGNKVCGRTWSTTPKYKRPGYYRVIELQAELNRRLDLKTGGGKFDLNTEEGWAGLRACWYYLKLNGVIPRATQRLGGLQTYYTDQEAEEVIAAVTISINRF